ncbi:cryptochrome/photolyase family protein [Vibrio intestinalis]|uniref:cryptochrome/photolyase family protein n=1 Tax=Vibrio intestinalis TaxID=2933291 RepID=UPI0021A70C63
MNIDRVRLILGDQLNHNHSWFNHVEPNTLYLIAELKQETGYVKHHVQKISAFFAAMEAFAIALQQEGHHVLHLTLDQSCEYKDLNHLIAAMVNQHSAKYFEYQRPDEFRLFQSMQGLELANCQINCVDSEHFLLPYDEISEYFKPNKRTVMEPFYRRMRKRYGILVEDGKPVGGKWNFDANNRNKLKVKDIDELPEPLMFSNDVSAILQRLDRHDVSTIGQASKMLLWPINRAQSLSLLAHFCRVCLPRFGQFQDAMTKNASSQWSLYHSRLSFALNAKLLSPKEVVDAALSAYSCDDQIDLAQIEGFVRQIIGWREYIRAIYWANMPHYGELNALSAHRKLPDYFWHGETKMSCLKQAITQSLEYAYAHHIQRLMVTGNFCLLTEIDPNQVDDWYLGIYIDAIEWVEMPNTRGMALFADGGIVGTKPYAASGAYTQRMSDYCKGCHYNQKLKSEENACPLNSLYWRFMVKHRPTIGSNPRMGMIFRSWDNMAEPAQQAILQRAEYYLQQIESL